MIEELWTKDNRQLETWRDAPTAELILHIVDHYHLEARQELGRMETLAELAVMLEGPAQPPMVQLSAGCSPGCWSGSRAAPSTRTASRCRR